MSMLHKLMIIVSSFIFLAPFSQAAEKGPTLFECLGREEKEIHDRKITGPQAGLNLFFINELITASDIEVKPLHLKQICEAKNFSSSVTLLRLLLLNGKKIFQLQGAENGYDFKYLQYSTIDELQKKLPGVFFQYLSGLQALAPTADCLFEKIPDLNYFMERFQYLENEFSAERLLKDKDRIDGVFKALTRYDKIISECQSIKDEQKRQQRHKKQKQKQKQKLKQESSSKK